MPNGGPRPDCLHCQHNPGPPRGTGELICQHHNMRFAHRQMTLYVFCSSYVDPEPNEKGDWLDQVLEDRSQLDPQVMYLWLKRSTDENDFFYVSLATIGEFQYWTHEIFEDRFINALDAYRT
jgi:hypothetical protein